MLVRVRSFDACIGVSPVTGSSGFTLAGTLAGAWYTALGFTWADGSGWLSFYADWRWCRAGAADAAGPHRRAPDAANPAADALVSRSSVRSPRHPTPSGEARQD